MTAERAVRIHTFHRGWHYASAICQTSECVEGTVYIAIPLTPETRAVIEEARKALAVYDAEPGFRTIGAYGELRKLLALVTVEEK